MKEENGDGEAAADGEAGKEADGKKGKKAKKEKKKKEPKEKKPPGPNCIDTLSAGLDVTFRDGKAINTCIDVSSSLFCTGFFGRFCIGRDPLVLFCILVVHKDT